MEFGGLESMVLDLSEGLAKLSQNQVIPFVGYFTKSEKTEVFLEKRKPENIELECFHKGNGVSPSLLLRLKDFIEKKGITLVHTHDIGPLIYISTLRKVFQLEFKHVHTAHSYHHLDKFKYKIYEKIFGPTADFYIYVSQGVRSIYMQKGLEVLDSAVINNGINQEGTSITNEEGIQQIKSILVESQFGNSPFKKDLLNKKWILCLGRKTAEKGQDRVMKLWLKCSPAIKSKFAILFVGPDTDMTFRDRLFQLANNEDGIYFVDAVDNPVDWMQASHLLVQLSRSEGLPLTPIESLFHLRPILLSDIPGHSEFSSFCTYLKNTKDESSFQLWIENKKTQTSREQLFPIYKTSRKSFSTEVMAQKYVSVYRREKK